jgi:hypothetical protein
MAGLLAALFRNESGGRNIANTDAGTSSGQAQGYFQITTGTWNDFGGQQYAPTPLQATYEQQAAVASKIPLKRWDESTVALMRATGKTIDPNRTLGENLAANGESFQGAARVSGPVEAAGGGAGADIGAPTLYSPPNSTLIDVFSNLNTDGSEPAPAAPYEERRSTLGDDLAASVSQSGSGRRLSEGGRGVMSGAPDGGFDNSTQAFDFGSPAPSDVGQDSPALEPSSSAQPLADLFKVRDIGQAALTDPRTGASLIRRQRRAYG